MKKVGIGNGSVGLISRLSSLKKTNRSVANQSNPFGVSFKGTVFAADVFKTSVKKVSMVEKVSAKGKLLASSVLGGLNNIKGSIKGQFKKIVSMGQKLKDNVKMSTDKAVSYVKNIVPQNPVEKLKKLPVSDLKEKLVAALA